MASFEDKLPASFDVKRFGALRPLIGWHISRGPDFIEVDQNQYANQLLDTYAIHQANSTRIQLTLNADLLPAYADDSLLPPAFYARYRSIISSLLYLSVITRHDLSLPVSALARHLYAVTARQHSYRKHRMRYLDVTPVYELQFSAKCGLDPSSLVAFVDAD